MLDSLTDEQLTTLLSAVPLAAQQREQAVRVNLRPGLPDDYTGLVELADLRLQLSPWHWLRAELAHTPRSQRLSREWADSAGTWSVEAVAEWLGEQATGWMLPSEPYYWGQYGTLDAMMESGEAHFLPPALRLVDVVAWFNESEDEGITALEVGWNTSEIATMGDMQLLGNAPGRGNGHDGSPGWLWSAAYLHLSDASTGESALLSAGIMPDEELEEAEEDVTTWRGQRPRFAAGTFYSTDVGNTPTWLAAGLRYTDHALYRADTGQLLVLDVCTGPLT